MAPMPLAAISAPTGSPAGPLLATEAGDPMPLGVALTLAVLLLGTAALLGWVAVRASAGRLDRNRRVGIRTPRTLGSDEAWRTAHRVAGPWLLAGAVAIAVPGAALLARPTNALGTLLVLTGSGLLVALVAVGALLGDRAAADP
jgi:uncharacterized membrane protein